MLWLKVVAVQERKCREGFTRRDLATSASSTGWYPWWNVLGEHVVITPADVIVQNRRRVMKWCMVFYWADGSVCTPVSVSASVCAKWGTRRHHLPDSGNKRWWDCVREEIYLCLPCVQKGHTTAFFNICHLTAFRGCNIQDRAIC